MDSERQAGKEVNTGVVERMAAVDSWAQFAGVLKRTVYNVP